MIKELISNAEPDINEDLSFDLERGLIDNSIDGIVIIDEALKVVEWNRSQERISGIKKEEALGEFLWDINIRLLPDENRSGIICRKIERKIKSLISKKNVSWSGKLLEMEIQRPDTSRRVVQTVPFLINTARGIIIVNIIRDITASRQNEELIRQKEKMQAIGQLAGGIAHDFNTQLDEILNFAELALQEVSQNSKAYTYLRNIIEGTAKSSDLTLKLLAFVRKGKFLSIPVNIHEVITEVISFFSYKMAGNIKIEHKLLAGEPCIKGDPVQLQNAIMNLALNAFDAMPKAGTLRVTTETVTLDKKECAKRTGDIRPGDFIKISVSDTGIGMSTCTRRRIFEPFFTTKDICKSAGMGLSAVFGTVNNHHGSIDVRTRKGAGTTFEILLPQNKVKDTGRAENPQEKMPDPVLRIMIVDDEPLFATSLRILLEREGYNICSCGSGKEAIEIYKKSWNEIDLIILDMIMPVMDGKETFAELKKINPRLKVLLLSGYSINERSRSTMHDGALGFIQKPVSKADLMKKISAVLIKKTKK